jgi:hypothetical protein
LIYIPGGIAEHFELYPQDAVNGPGVWLWTTSFGMYMGLVSALFAVTCHRIVLLGPETAPRFGIRPPTAREVHFILYSATLFLLSKVAILSKVGVIFWADKLTRGPVALLMIDIIFGYAIFLLGYYVVARVSLLLPSIAIDQQRTVHEVWDLSKSNGWRLVVITGLLPLVFITVLVLLEGLLTSASKAFENEAFEIATNIAWYALFAVDIAALSLSYKYLSTRVKETDSSSPVITA